jgi:hypothetical protein
MYYLFILFTIVVFLSLLYIRRNEQTENLKIKAIRAQNAAEKAADYARIVTKRYQESLSFT